MTAKILAIAIVVMLPGLAAATSPATPLPAAHDAAAIEAGRRLFIRCNACHSPDASSRALTGPHLEGIVGRPSASVPGFHYSIVSGKRPFVWTRDRLDRWLRQPQKDFPGLCLPFTGLKRKSDRAALIAYLERPGP